MTFPEYESYDGLGLAELIKKRVVTCEELLRAAIERIEQYNPKLNAVIHKMYDTASATIKATLPEGMFTGVPILLKDLLADYEGAPICFGSRYALNWISKNDSELVKRLKQSGVVILGKTNVPEFGLSPVTEPIAFGPTYNPWDLTRTAGGSSGGSAVAVASRMVPIAHAGDGGGSIRIPSAYCGVFGFKPSRGRTPTGPLNMRVWLGMVTEHAVSRSVRDSAAMLDALSGFEIGSQISQPKPKNSFLSQIEHSPKRLRIAVIDQPFFPVMVDPEYKKALQSAAKLCKELGHDVESAVLPHNEEDVFFAFLTMMISETSAGLKKLTKAMGRNPKKNELEIPTAALCQMGDKLSALSYAHAIWVLDMAAAAIAAFYEKYDVILTPTMPFPAPKIGSLKIGISEKLFIKFLRFFPYSSILEKLTKEASIKQFSFMAFTAMFNIGGQPAMSVPLYWDKQNMPIGIQFAGRINEDATLLQLARQLEMALPWDERKPITLDSEPRNFKMTS